MWCAPTAEIVGYTLAARDAKVKIQKGRLTVTLSDSAPAAALTLKLTGMSENSKLIAPEGGSLYRQGTTVWVTSPLVGQQGSPPPKPALKLVYQGPVKNVTFDSPQSLAAVRLMQVGETSPLKIEWVSPDGKTESLVAGEKARVKPQWGVWLLFPTIPDRPSVLAREVRVAPDRALQAMEIWAEADGTAGLVHNSLTTAPNKTLRN